MIATLNPDANVISATTLKRDLAALFDARFEKVKLRMSQVPGKISFTFDAWTSKNVLGFVAIRAHFINANWEYESIMLDFVPLETSHKGSDVCNLFLDCLKRFDIPFDKVLGLTMDNALANDTFIEALISHGIQYEIDFTKADHHVRCLAHVLNLSVQDMLNSLKVSLVFEEADDESKEDDEEEDEEEESENEDDGEEESDVEVCFFYKR